MDPVFSRITSTILQFQKGQRIDAGTHYASRRNDLPNKRMFIETHVHGRLIKSELTLQGPDGLDFSIVSDDPSLPEITGRFLDTNYQESIISGALPAQGLKVAGSVSKLSEMSAISIKIVSDLASGATVAVAQEKIELITEEEFKIATG